MERRAEDNEETGEPSGEAIRSRLSNRADPFLVVCRCFSFVTSLVAILCVVVNVLAAIRSFRDSHDIFDGIFRCYAVLIACFVVLAETEWGFILKFSKVLEYWAGRGMLQIFVAVMTRAFPDYMTQRKDLLLLQNIASYMLLACGLIYFISVRCHIHSSILPSWLRLCLYDSWNSSSYCFLYGFGSAYVLIWFNPFDCKGILCIGFLKRARQKKEISKDQAVKDLEARDTPTQGRTRTVARGASE
ncbi:hypothetical protein F2Q70_00033452 [Brassica cretica]|uniref:Transmembrane protein n=1 Tax=Brassica cretica TaxID=69181 RepID=A0A8S9FIB8_BRACR|nr:hypothetical protein F2Q70_00033452 [Brassica cretica]